jgi:DNA-binding response OmpR family regulator
MSAPTPPKDNSKTKRTRVLLLEDDAGVRRSLHLMLHGAGYEVRSYSAAAALLADRTIDEALLLIADYRLADGDGVEVMRALRQRGWNGRALMITAFPSPALRAAALEAGYDMVFDKPLLQHELLGALRERNGDVS